MSTRFYPRFVKGNPQLRVFLPDWKMVLIKPKQNTPANVVTFKTDPRMTDWDIKNYLEKIYKIRVVGIRSEILAGPLKKTVHHGLTKLNDYKIAHVSLPFDQKFTWPDLFPQDKLKEEITDYEKTLEDLSEKRKQDPNKTGVPTWLL